MAPAVLQSKPLSLTSVGFASKTPAWTRNRSFGFHLHASAPRSHRVEGEGDVLAEVPEVAAHGLIHVLAPQRRRREVGGAHHPAGPDVQLVVQEVLRNGELHQARYLPAAEELLDGEEGAHLGREVHSVSVVEGQPDRGPLQAEELAEIEVGSPGLVVDVGRVLFEAADRVAGKVDPVGREDRYARVVPARAKAAPVAGHRRLVGPAGEPLASRGSHEQEQRGEAGGRGAREHRNGLGKRRSRSRVAARRMRSSEPRLDLESPHRVPPLEAHRAVRAPRRRHGVAGERACVEIDRRPRAARRERRAPRRRDADDGLRRRLERGRAHLPRPSGPELRALERSRGSHRTARATC